MAVSNNPDIATELTILDIVEKSPQHMMARVVEYVRRPGCNTR
jgi:hypothetical protein